ncbi:MAG: hypothetical protein ACREQ5_17690 [Candidatus Dormibacteria bacterium]
MADSAADLAPAEPDRRGRGAGTGPTPTRRFRFTCHTCGRQNENRARLGTYHRCKHCGVLNPGPAILRAVAEAPSSPPIRARRLAGRVDPGAR